MGYGRLITWLLLASVTTGCNAVTPNGFTGTPAILQGRNPDIRDRLLNHIPIGTSRATAEQTARELGLELVPQIGLSTETQDSVQCQYTGRSGLFGQATWLIQIHCPEGKVAEIICEKIEVDY